MPTARIGRARPFLVLAAVVLVVALMLTGWLAAVSLAHSHTLTALVAGGVGGAIVLLTVRTVRLAFAGRADRAAAPDGCLLEPDDHPRLWEAVRDVATRRGVRRRTGSS